MNKEHYCNREAARQHGDDIYVNLLCTCGQCRSQEQAFDFLEWLAKEHHSQEDHRFDDLVVLYGYALPGRVWRYVEDELRYWRQAEAEQAEAAAGWDPNP